MEAELQERVESSQKQANHVVEIYERLKSTVDQLKAELDSGAGEIKWRHDEFTVMETRMKFIWKEIVKLVTVLWGGIVEWFKCDPRSCVVGGNRPW